MARIYNTVKMPDGTRISVARDVFPDNKLRCKRCKKIFPNSEFYYSFNRRDQRWRISSYCKKCNHLANYENSTIKAGETPRKFMARLRRSCKGNAKQRGIDYFLPKEWWEYRYSLQEGLCYYTGIAMTHESGNGKQNTNISIDRVYSDGPYSPENCVLCCLAMNTKMKNDMTLEELYIFSKAYVRKYETGLTTNAVDLAPQVGKQAELQLFNSVGNGSEQEPQGN